MDVTARKMLVAVAPYDGAEYWEFDFRVPGAAAHGGEVRRPGIAAAALLMALLPSCGQIGRVPADTVRIAIKLGYSRHQSGVDRDANTDSVLAHVVEGLVTYDEH